MNNLKIIVNSRIWIPYELVKEGAELEINKNYLKTVEKYIFDDQMCKMCSNMYKRPCQFCKNCKGLKKVIKLHGIKKQYFDENPNINEYYCLPLGCLEDIINRPSYVFAK